MHKCQCGCGKRVRWIFVHGHNRRGIPSWLKGLTKESDIRVAKLAAKAKGRKSWAKGLTKETDERLKRASEKPRKVYEHTSRFYTKEAIKRRSEAHSGSGHSRGMLGKLHTDETKCRMSKTHKQLWNDPSYTKRMCHRRIPSKPEIVFCELCMKSDLPFQFVGDGKLWIGGKNPDFVGTIDDRKLIEIWGDFYHRGQNPDERIQFFIDRGYSCLVIWASELKDSDTLVTKVRKFLTESEVAK